MKLSYTLTLTCLLIGIHIYPAYGDEIYDAAIAFGGILKQALRFVPGLPPYIGAADILTNMIKTSSVLGIKNPDLWTQIDAKVSIKVGKALSGYHLNDVKSEFRLFTKMIAKQSNFSKDDLDYIMAKQLRIIPQNYDKLGFTSQFATLLPAWTAYMVAGHLELISRKQLSKCSLATELQTLRRTVVNAAKSLFQKRYRDLKGIKFYRGSPDDGCSGKGIQCRFMARVVFTDSCTNRKLDTVIGEFFSNVLEVIRKETLDLLWNVLIQPINAYFKSTICLSGCQCPKPILKDEIEFFYPRECYGTAINKKRCTLPCQTYGDGNHWCPQYSYTIPKNNLMTFNDWKYCTPVDFSTCMLVPSVGYTSKS